MTDRVWLGARGDRAANPGNWSPKGVPQPGDALAMTQGTMSIKDDDLAGNQLLIGTPAAATSETLNLSHQGRCGGDHRAAVGRNGDGERQGRRCPVNRYRLSE